MAHRNPDSLRFASLGSRKIEADFAGGRITSDSGVLLLREIDRRTGLIDALDKALPDPRDPARIEHDQKTMLAQRIYAITLGYEDLNDHKTLRTDPALRVAVDQPPGLRRPHFIGSKIGPIASRSLAWPKPSSMTSSHHTTSRPNR